MPILSLFLQRGFHIFQIILTVGKTQPKDILSHISKAKEAISFACFSNPYSVKITASVRMGLDNLEDMEEGVAVMEEVVDIINSF